MKEFKISLHSFREVYEFVSMAARTPCRVSVGNERLRVSAKSLIAMFCLDYRRPLTVVAEGGEEACTAFFEETTRFHI